MNSQKLKIVKERLELIKNLNLFRNVFMELDTKTRRSKIENFQVYQNYHGLRIYLCLTCFDIIGQNNDWIDFNSWLTSSNKEQERKLIFKKNEHLKKEEIPKAIKTYYDKIYGVKNAFKRFLNEMLSKERKADLLASINVEKFNFQEQEKLE